MTYKLKINGKDIECDTPEEAIKLAQYDNVEKEENNEIEIEMPIVTARQREKPWSKEEYDKMNELFKEGRSWQFISDTLGRTLDSIKKKRWEATAGKLPLKLRDNPTKHRRRKHAIHRKIEASEIDLIAQDIIVNGKSVYDVARNVKRSVASVYNIKSKILNGVYKTNIDVAKYKM